MHTWFTRLTLHCLNDRPQVDPSYLKALRPRCQDKSCWDGVSEDGDISPFLSQLLVSIRYRLVDHLLADGESKRGPHFSVYGPCCSQTPALGCERAWVRWMLVIEILPLCSQGGQLLRVVKPEPCPKMGAVRVEDGRPGGWYARGRCGCRRLLGVFALQTPGCIRWTARCERL